MGYKVNNLDFFKTKAMADEKEKQENEKVEGGVEEEQEQIQEEKLKEKPAETAKGAVLDKETGRKKINAEPVKINPEIIHILKTAKKLFSDADLPMLVQELNRMEENLAKNFFSIAVVGEFSKGKSSFLNALLEKEVLPVGNLPTTAMMTRIRYSSKEMMIVFDENGKKKESLPLSEDSWEGLVAENFNGEDPKGVILAGVNLKWLNENSIELIDTPGAGDLEEARARVIGDALIGCDGAVITVSASAVLSMSERLFIEERLISRKTPFLMLIITKLDQVPKEQRAGIIRYTKEKLSLWKADIPVYIPYPVEMENDEYQDIVGMDKIKAQMEEWTTDPERAKLTGEWLAARLLSVMDTGASVFSEQRLMLDVTDEQERERLIAEKKAQISKAQIVWEDLRLQLMERSNQCYELLLEKSEEYSELIIEKLQYELSHTNTPEKWWKEDYPYRAKVELANMMMGINNIVLKRIGEDTQWFNVSIDKNFKTHVLCRKETIADKGAFKEISIKENITFEDIQKEKTAVRVGTAAATIAGVLLMTSTGVGLPILATTGIGTGVSLVSEKIFRGKIEKQKEALKSEIVRNIPVLIQNAMQESEKRLKAVYQNVMNEAVKSEGVWLEAQRAAAKTVTVKDTEQKKQVYSRLAQLEQIQKKLQNI